MAQDPTQPQQTLCKRCGAPFEPHTSLTPSCTVCVRYNAVESNAAKTRRDGNAPGLDLDRSQFALWFTHQDRACVYCGITETDLPRLGLTTQVGLPLQRLGIDRRSSTEPYRLGNIALCCFACNKVKSNTFTDEEMRQLGATVAALWADRLAGN